MLSNHQRNLVIFGAVLLLLVAGMQACMKIGGTGQVPNLTLQQGASSGSDTKNAP